MDQELKNQYSLTSARDALHILLQFFNVQFIVFFRCIRRSVLQRMCWSHKHLHISCCHFGHRHFAGETNSVGTDRTCSSRNETRICCFAISWSKKIMAWCSISHTLHIWTEERREFCRDANCSFVPAHRKLQCKQPSCVIVYFWGRKTKWMSNVKRWKTVPSSPLRLALLLRGCQRV